MALTAMATDCKRVGFERSTGGKAKDEGSFRDQPFTSIPMNSKYGLKRLRQWMKDNSDWQSDTRRAEILPTDSKSIEHCERLRDHSFDMRHASECIRHSQLCGPGGGLVLPVASADMCRSISNVSWLEQTAVSLGDDPETGLFATWRKMQQEIGETTGFDGKKLQCLRTLCEYGGLRAGALKLHPDRVNLMDISDDEKAKLSNTFSFLTACKSDYTGLDGEELTLNKKEEREAICNGLASIS